jgi:hypothetical protein
MADGPKYPLSWKQKRAPTRGTRRSTRWRQLYPGYRFPEATWVIVEGPWRKVKKTGSVSWVRVLCSTEHGGCGVEYDRKLDPLIQGISKGCKQCHMKKLNRANALRREQAKQLGKVASQ